MTRSADTYGAFLQEVHALAQNLTLENVTTKTVEIGALLDTKPPGVFPDQYDAAGRLNDPTNHHPLLLAEVLHEAKRYVKTYCADQAIELPAEIVAPPDDALTLACDQF